MREMLPTRLSVAAFYPFLLVLCVRLRISESFTISFLSSF